VRTLIARINRPEYLFRPGQIFKRLFNHQATVDLPWKVKMTVNLNETIGRSIINTGFHDLTVTESIVRLLEKGETAIDAGANIGYFTLLMSKMAGPSGRVLSFEPHPEIFQNLKRHVVLNGLTNVSLFETGLSGRASEGFLVMPDDFKGNQGIASVSFSDSGSNQIKIKLAALDELYAQPIGVLKIDVEGHELELLHGASNLLKKGLVRDLIFEDHHVQPSAVSLYLKSFDYSIFRIEKNLFRPRLHPFDTNIQLLRWETPNYIATLDGERVKKKFKPWGWKCMRM
jgi:FkbM family methyltransferase